MDFCHISAKIGPMIPSKAHFWTDHGLVWCYQKSRSVEKLSF
jgi:hypothetical protein